jgi:LEA14-like dessication related protein
MLSARSLLVATAAVLSLSACSACSPPEAPTVKPISGRVTGINTGGLEVEAKLEAWNPNDFDIQVKGFSADVMLDKKIDLGTVTSSVAVTLPARKKKVFEIPIGVKWNDAAAVAPLAFSNRDVPWAADGTVKISARSLDVDVPFKVSGVVTHAQIVQAVGRSVPKIPGLPF